MASVEEVRRDIELARQKASEGIASVRQATLALEEAQQMLASAAHGSNQDDIQRSTGMLVEAANNLSGVEGTINASINIAEEYAGRL